MEIIRSVKEMQQKVAAIRQQKRQIGFIPTMGFFHEGHTSLMTEAKKENDVIATSIFVNPLQFGPNEDYEQYPRNEEQDIIDAEQSGVDIVFIPDVKDMYPDQPMIKMDITDRVHVLCGRSRPGHFEGVLTVLTKLFHIVQPDKVYFGLKDAQQVAVVSALILDLNFPIELVGLPTIREQDGLAKSSRNVYLSKAERKEASWLYKALTYGQQLVVDGESNPDIIVKEVIESITKETTSSVEYVEILSYPELKPVNVIKQQVILAVAVQFKQARLIDNLLFNKNGQVVEAFKIGGFQHVPNNDES
ncbi:MAG TPA: pantoate--beta-alanine ligase [Virgibacillus sp.]|nr:pantoate--beta-alanine ligase [Virgibacillus sp.]